jgi:hypothetical protein
VYHKRAMISLYDSSNLLLVYSNRPVIDEIKQYEDKKFNAAALYSTDYNSPVDQHDKLRLLLNDKGTDESKKIKGKCIISVR